jgi:hypothetical protein
MNETIGNLLSSVKTAAQLIGGKYTPPIQPSFQVRHFSGVTVQNPNMFAAMNDLWHGAIEFSHPNYYASAFIENEPLELMA